MGYNLNILNNTYYNVQGIKVKGQNNNDNIYLPAKVQTLSALSNGFYIPPDDETVYDTIIANVSDATPAYDLSTWQGLFKLGMSGHANLVLELGGTIDGTYTSDEGKVYSYPWIIVDFRDVETEDGIIYHNVPILQAQRVPHDSSGPWSGNMPFDPAEPGNPITTVASKGDQRWKYSFIRQYMNGFGTDWWQPVNEYDVRSTYPTTGFMSRLNSELCQRIKPIKIYTPINPYFFTEIDDNDSISYDCFWLASTNELNRDIGVSHMPKNGEPFQLYKQGGGSYKKYPFTKSSGEGVGYWLRNAYISSTWKTSFYYINFITSTGAFNINYNTAGAPNYTGNTWGNDILPCFALIGDTGDLSEPE